MNLSLPRSGPGVRGRRDAIIEIPGPGLPRLLRIGSELLVLSSGERTVSFDFEGRPRGGWDGRRGWRRGLDGSVIVSSREHGEWIHRRSGAASITARSRCRWARVWAANAVRRLRRAGLDRPAGRLEPAAGGREGDAVAFAEVYAPVPILPPDQYAAVLLQVSRGCIWNRCGFCSFYRGREHRLLSPDEARSHATAVRTLLGRGLIARRGVFFGDADAVSAPSHTVERWLEIAREAFPVQASRGIASFVDLAAVRARGERAWRRLRERGLCRLYAGVETGDEDLRRRLGKRGRPVELLVAARSACVAGISLVPIFLAGREEGLAGPRHLAASLEWLEAVGELCRQTVLVSPLNPPDALPGDPRWHASRQAARDFERGLRNAGVGKVALYDVTRSIY